MVSEVRTIYCRPTLPVNNTNANYHNNWGKKPTGILHTFRVKLGLGLCRSVQTGDLVDPAINSSALTTGQADTTLLAKRPHGRELKIGHDSIVFLLSQSDVLVFCPI